MSQLPDSFLVSATFPLDFYGRSKKENATLLLFLHTDPREHRTMQTSDVDSRPTTVCIYVRGCVCAREWVLSHIHYCPFISVALQSLARPSMYCVPETENRLKTWAYPRQALALLPPSTHRLPLPPPPTPSPSPSFSPSPSPSPCSDFSSSPAFSLSFILASTSHMPQERRQGTRMCSARTSLNFPARLPREV